MVEQSVLQVLSNIFLSLLVDFTLSYSCWNVHFYGVIEDQASSPRFLEASLLKTGQLWRGRFHSQWLRIFGTKESPFSFGGSADIVLLH